MRCDALRLLHPTGPTLGIPTSAEAKAMMTTPIPSNAAIVAALDPTYTLKPGPWRLTHEHLGAYLRFHYLLVGPLIVPRTYFIHGRHNPFVDLHESGKQGRREICDLLTSGAAYVTGHDHPAFQTLADPAQQRQNDTQWFLIQLFENPSHASSTHFSETLKS